MFDSDDTSEVSDREAGPRLRGFIDTVTSGALMGWVRSSAGPTAGRLGVELVAGREILATAEVGDARGDLADAFGDDGRHGFTLPLSRARLRELGDDCGVRVSGTGVVLPWAAGTRETLAAMLSAPEPDETLPGGEANEILAGREPGPVVSALLGEIEEVTPFIIRGWAADPGEPDLPITVEVLWGHTILAIGEAEPVAEGEGEAATRRTFAVTLPPHRASAPEELACSLRCGERSLALSHPPLGPDLAWGDFEVVNAATVSGWVAPHADGSSTEVEVVCDGKPVWRGPARRRRGQHTIGFRVDLPEPDDWDAFRTVGVRLAVDSRALGTERMVRALDRFRVNVDEAKLEAGRLRVAGWIQDTARPRDSVGVELLLDGVTAFRVLAGEQRADLVRLGIGSGRHGFAFDLPWPDTRVPGRVDIALAHRSAVVVPDVVLVPSDEPVQPLAVETSAMFGTANNAETILTPRDRTWAGSIDTVCCGQISGWVRCDAAPDDTALLDLFLDGSYYYSTRSGRHRADVGRKFGDHGNLGFFFELPPTLAGIDDIHVKVIPRSGKATYTTERVLKRTVQGLALNVAPPALGGAGVRTRSEGSDRTKIAYIVLNRNAASLLEELFESFARHNQHHNYEMIVVDHASNDTSLDVCNRWTDRLTLRVLPRERNFNFSESNNLGARETDADILVFLNNDIVFIQDIGSELVRVLSDPTIGVAGTKLLDRASDMSLASAPIQHLGVHFNCMDRENFAQPFESRYTEQLRHVAHNIYDVPVVTGALLACRREEFLSSGGFDEGYGYGYEDVDLCLRFLQRQRRVVCANHLAALHVRGHSRAKMGKTFDQQLTVNNLRLHTKLGRFLRRSQALDRFDRPGFWTTTAPRIAFAVTEVSDSAIAGDYFTALELARELAEICRCQIVFFDQKNWFDLTGIDVLISMVDTYDLRKIQNLTPHLIRIGWARNWVDRWVSRDWAGDFDALWASSDYAADYLRRALARPVEVVRIATNTGRLAAGRYSTELASDFCFTGSYFAAPREILYYLDPSTVPFKFAVFGHGWEAVPEFTPYNRGPVPYSVMSDVYASTKIVIDDANSATKQWGSVNSRVFDALAAGALVITNGKLGADEVFGGLLPTYSSTQELEMLLWHYLMDEDARTALVAELTIIVNSMHTYAHRAASVDRHLRSLSRDQRRFSIKIAAPAARVRDEWGDYHFALGLKRALTRLGHTVRIDCLDRWEGNHTLGDDIVLVLRGLSSYRTKSHQINLMWMISHPHDVTRGELDKYDHVFVASNIYAEVLAKTVRTPVTPLLQCTDPEIFNPGVPMSERTPNFLFVGNSRNIFRSVVKDLFELGHSIDVYGSRWEQFLPEDMIRGTHIHNTEVPRHYRSASWVLNDHWDDMKEQGFISNRVFDATACGARVLSDSVIGIDSIFGGLVKTYESRAELQRVLSQNDVLDLDAVDRIRLSKHVIKHHSFDSRVSVIVKICSEIFKKDPFKVSENF